MTDRFVDWVVDERANGEFASDSIQRAPEAGWKQSFGGLPGDAVRRPASIASLDARASRSEPGAPGILGLTFGSRCGDLAHELAWNPVGCAARLSNGQTLTPFARVAWVHEFDPDRGVSSILTCRRRPHSLPRGLGGERAARVTAGLRLDLTDRVALFGYFDGEFSDRSQTYTGNAGVKISW